MFHEIFSSWIHYVSAFIIIILGTILNGLVSIKSRDKKWIVKMQKNPSPLIVFIIVEAILIYVGSTVLQPYLNGWLAANIILIPSILIESLVLFYIWFNLAFGFKLNRFLLVMSQFLAVGIGVFFYTNVLYTIYYIVGLCISSILYYIIHG